MLKKLLATLLIAGSLLSCGKEKEKPKAETKATTEAAVEATTKESVSGEAEEVGISAEKTEHKVIVKGTEDVNEQTITIAATSDVHGRIYPHDYATDSEDDDAGFAKIASIIKGLREKNPNLILMDDGDTVQDNSAELFNDLETHPIVEAMNEINYDIWTLGNHEFNFEKEFIVRNINNFKGTVLAANIKNEKDGSHFVKPYQIFEINGAKVAVVGIIVPYVPMWEASSPSHFKGLKFDDVLESTKETVKSLEGQYDVLVGSFHLAREDEHGGKGIYDIAKAVPEFDVIFGGHEHAITTEEVEGTAILEPGFAGAIVSKADIKIKKTGDKWEVEDVKMENIETKETPADEAVLASFKDVHEKSLANANEVIGTIEEDFIKGVDFITGEDKVTTMPRSQMEANAIVDLINDVQLKYTGAEVSAAAIFKSNQNLKAGDFKRKDVANIYKYTNTLMGVNMTGENLLKFMEWSASYFNTWKEGDVTISFDEEIRGYNYDMFAGINYEIDLSKEAGNRIVNATINGQPIDPKKTYKVAVNNYRFGTLTKHGWATTEDKFYDSYEELQDAGRIRDLIVKYVQEEKGGKVTPVVHGNWKLTGMKLDYPESKEIYEKIKSGEIVIPKSEDGRTLNTKSINVKDLKK